MNSVDEGFRRDGGSLSVIARERRGSKVSEMPPSPQSLVLPVTLRLLGDEALAERDIGPGGDHPGGLFAGSPVPGPRSVSASTASARSVGSQGSTASCGEPLNVRAAGRGYTGDAA